MSIYKKFPFIITFIILSLLSVLTLAVYLKGVYEKIEQKNQYATLNHLNIQNETIHEYLQKVKNDIHYFSDLYTIYAKLDNSPRLKNKMTELESSISSFSKFNRIYSQIRYVDLKGKEFLRINNKKGKVEIVLKEKLQNKSTRYYFQDSTTLHIGEIYISPFDLNMENGKIEIPYNPTLRISTPLQLDGKIAGYVIVNYAGDEMIKAILKGNGTKYITHFINKDSFYMISPGISKEWAFMFNKDITLQNDNLPLWEKIQSLKNGNFEDDQYYYSFLHTDPVEVLSPERKTESRRSWFLITSINKHIIYNEFLEYLKSIVIMVAVFSIIITIISTIIATYVKKLNIAQAEAEITNKKLAEADKLSALGQLIAGIAHEINSPLGAIKTSSSNTYDTITKFVENMQKIDHILTTKEKEEYEKIQSLIPKELSLLSIKEQRDLKKKFREELKEKGVANDRLIAEYIVNIGIHDLEEYGTLLAHPKNIDIFKTLNDEFITFANLLNIQRSVDRASRTIFALKKFAHFDYDRHGVVKTLQSGIEDTLTLLHHNIKQGIELQREFKELEPIFFYEDELVQVWMNLITNAIHAMDNQGTLTIKLYEEDDYQVVSISDTGSGIPKELQEKIFEPFFTTKEAGIGSGLGLDIVKKIVDAHNAIINLQSSNKGTTFYVKIPKNLKSDTIGEDV